MHNQQKLTSMQQLRFAQFDSITRQDPFSRFKGHSAVSTVASFVAVVFLSRLLIPLLKNCNDGFFITFTPFEELKNSI